MLGKINIQDIKEIKAQVGDILKPFVFKKVTIRSKTGKKISGDIIVVPYTANELIKLLLRKSAQFKFT